MSREAHLGPRLCALRAHTGLGPGLRRDDGQSGEAIRKFNSGQKWAYAGMTSKTRAPPKNLWSTLLVIPAKAGTQWLLRKHWNAKALGPGYRFAIPGWRPKQSLP